MDFVKPEDLTAKLQTFTLTNKQDTKVTILNLGGIVHEFILNSSTAPQNLLVSCSPLVDYVLNPFNVNKQIGRVAGRIGNASFKLGEQLIKVEANQGVNCLHGGTAGMGNQWFAGEQVSTNKCRLSKLLTPEVDGFPGELEVMLEYELTEDNQLILTYHATAQSPSVFDPTSHTYWRIEPTKSSLQINGEHYQLDQQQLPVAVDNNPVYDFKQPKNLEQALSALQAFTGNPVQAFDEVYQVGKQVNNSLPLVAELNVASLYNLKVYSARNGLVIFTANPLDVKAHDQGVFNSLALEPQTLPNSLNQPEFGEIRLEAGQTTSCQIVFAVTSLI
ncbi:hypothetical protein CKF54_00745 [Psittacicella hinzii]|uniref:Aldose 1-epimerase n=1 Tax=Psittacicella hinzii TaxID=2028575 RepID=A0A3A1Y9N0_9GAMM|nr:galactose mutarotase [Psittacicella hinzii]RIY34385.1 hypothetical protein CKF54_00745 [Psittacicella hinzii]